MSADYLCKLTAQVNTLTASLNAMQNNAGLYTDASSEETITGRVRKLEEMVINEVPTETNISRMRVEHDLVVTDGKITTEYYPVGGCVNRELMLQNPEDLDIWEPIGGVEFNEDVGYLGTNDYDGWLATVTYLYASKITVENFSFTDAVEELIKDFSSYGTAVYKLDIYIVPNGQCTLKWESVVDATDYVEEVIDTDHRRYVHEEEFAHKLYITGTAEVEIQVRNRIA